MLQGVVKELAGVWVLRVGSVLVRARGVLSIHRPCCSVRSYLPRPLRLSALAPSRWQERG
jgi:hypothetical protein